MKKPYVICHMASTVNGRIITENWGEKKKRKIFSSLYEKCHDSFGSEAWMVGRITMEKDFIKGKKIQLAKAKQPIERKPFIGDKGATSFAIAVDGKGKLRWQHNEIGGDHIIEILTEQVSDRYLQYLQQQNISYLFAGEKELNFASALQQISKLFPVKTLMLEGGGLMNGSLLNAGLIDELSLLLLPIADGKPGTPSTFDISDYLQKKPASYLKLKDMQALEHDVLWLRYLLKKR